MKPVETVDAMEALTTKQVAELLNVSRRTVQNMLTSGELRGWRVRSDWRVYRADVTDYVEGQRAKALAEAQGEGRRD